MYLESMLNKRGDYITDDEDTAALKRVGDYRYVFSRTMMFIRSLPISHFRFMWHFREFSLYQS